MATYIGQNLTQGSRQRVSYTATLNQTTFSAGYAPGFVDVYQNGLLLPTSEYTATDGSTVVLNTGAALNDEIEIIGQFLFAVDDTVSSSFGGTFNNTVNVLGDFTVDTNTLYVDAANNRVGIGTTAPSEKLEVSGNVKVGTGGATDYNRVSFIRYGGANVGAIGWHSDGDFYVGGHPNHGSTAGNNVKIYGFGSDLHLGDNSNGDVLTVQYSSGNVGIGTSSPNSPLDVNGAVTSTVGTNARTFTATDGTQYVSLVADLGNSGYNGLSTAGDVGIIFTTDGDNTTDESGKGLVIAPWASGAKGMKIQEDGNILFGTTHNVDQGLRILHGSASRSWGIKLDDDETDATFNYIEFLSGGSTTTGGSVRGSIIGTSSGTTYNTTSDRRLKENIELITDGKERILAMKPSTFNFIADETKTKMHGFVAQEMQEIVPEAVNDGTTMSMDYGRITPVIVAALQDALKEIEQLKARINELEK